ncbi:MAG TPA: DNA polymerase/3'-5' exonuclease PolX [Candidatus Nanoarchaeia archaeon]|nr:DNA polymerase/3'-5' exonuclease PolX [Candidatus Nanoarchaeia archaeon]
MKNQLIVKILNNIADILELQEVAFKPIAYRRAAQSIEALSENIEAVYERGELEEISGVGRNIAEKIAEIIETGKLKYYERLKKEVKVDVEQLNQIPSLGPKKIKVLYQKLGVKDLKDLEKVLKQHKVRDLEGFGEKTEETLSHGIELLKKRPSRFLYIHALPMVEMVKKNLERHDFVKKVEVAGSFRRGKETVGDLDFLAVSSQPKKVMDVFTSMKEVKEVLAKGETKSSIRLSNGLQVDLRVVTEKEFGAALLYFIGSKEHNVELRKLALKKGWTLNEYGLTTLKENKWIAGRTQEEIYQKLGLRFIEPELRENRGEIEAARAGKLPLLITAKDIKGVFHNHTTWSDGHNSHLEMAQKAEELGLKFMSFNDHFGHVGITNPLTQKRLGKYLQEISKVQKKVGIKIFTGVEIDILKDGSLPLSAAKLRELDVVIASVHMAIKMKEQEMTSRVCKALRNYPINILGHPQDRILGEREALALNLNKVFETAKEHNVFVEINGSPKRMDLPGELVKSGVDLGCKFALSTDAHAVTHLPFYSLGVNMARRGWIEQKHLLNTWTLGKIEKVLHSK